MIISFKYGFEHDDFIFGWHKKELYRLPILVKGRKYGLKKLSLINVGRQQGYRVKRQKLSIEQLRQKTIFINRQVEVIQGVPDMP